MLDIPCGTCNTQSNRDYYIPLVDPGFAIIVNKGDKLECVPVNKLNILRLAIPNLEIIYE